MKLQDKVIIVTGASEGLGKAITSSLVSKGARVIAIARNASKLKKLTDELGDSVRVYSCDIRDTQKFTTVLERSISDLGQVDGIVNCAGVWHKMDKLENINSETIAHVIGINLTALIQGTAIVLPFLKRRDEAIIVNISSKSGTRPQEGQTVYCASKFGVRGFTDTLKLELKGGPVKVMGFYPSGMNTELFAKANESFPVDKFMNVDGIADIITYAMERPGNISIEEIQVEKY